MKRTSKRSVKSPPERLTFEENVQPNPLPSSSQSPVSRWGLTLSHLQEGNRITNELMKHQREKLDTVNKNQKNLFRWVRKAHPAIEHCLEKGKKRGDDNSIYHLNQIKQAPQQKETFPLEVIVLEPGTERHSD